MAACGDDAWLDRRELSGEVSREAGLELRFDWSAVGAMPSGMTMRIMPRHSAQIDEITNNVANYTTQLKADTFRMLAYNLTPSEYVTMDFHNTDNTDSTYVMLRRLTDHQNETWEGALLYQEQPEPIAVAQDSFSVTKQQVAAAQRVVRNEMAFGLCDTLLIRVRVKGMQNLRNVTGAISGFAGGRYLASRSSRVEENSFFLDTWFTETENGARPFTPIYNGTRASTMGWISTEIPCFGLPFDKQNLTGRDAKLNLLLLHCTLVDGSTRDFSFHVGDRFIYHSPSYRNVVTVIELTLREDFTNPELPPVVLPDVTPSNGSSGFDARVDPWEEGENTDVHF